MPQDVYADLLFLINFSMDYLCLYVCARILHRKLRLGRMITAAVIGGLYSVIALLLPTWPLFTLAIDVGVCLIMCAIVFSERGRSVGSTLLCTFLFVGISMMTGGCMTAVFNLLNRLDLPLENVEADGITTYLFAILAALAGVISLRSGQLISRRATIKECLLTITVGEKHAVLLGLSDSGNLVKDPMSGRAVILIDRAALEPLYDLKDFDHFAQGDQTSPIAHRLRLIPIRTASGKGMLVATRADKIMAEILDNNRKSTVFELDALIAPSDIQGSAEGYSAIVPSEILKD